MLELKNVGYTYKGNPSTLSEISLKFPPKDVVCIVGPNDAGKSTLIKCINRILKAQGEVLFQGQEIRDMSISQIAKIIGYVPQSFNASFPITVFDMVLLGRKAYIGWKPSD